MGSDFFETTIGDQITLQRGFDITKKDQKHGVFPVVSSGGVSSFHDESKVAAPGVVLGRKGSLGTVFYMDFDFWPHDTTLWVKDFKNNHPRFVYYFFRDMAPALKRMDVGAANPALNRNHVHPLPIVWPSADNQQKIAHFLGTLDDKIELNRQMNTTLEAMAQALFKSWFVDFDPVIDNALAAGNPIPDELSERAERRKQLHARSAASSSAHLTPGEPLPVAIQQHFPDRFVFTETMGWVPEGWEVSSVGNEFDVTMGQSPPGDTYNNKGIGLPFFQGCTDFGFRYPSNRIFCTVPKRLAQDGDTLVSVRAPVGQVNMASESCCIGRGVSASRHKSGSRSLTYYAMRQLRARFTVFEGEGTVFGSINQKEFKALPQVKFPQQLVTNFESIAANLDSKIASNEAAIDNLVRLRDTLLPKLLSGQLRIPEAEQQLGEVI